MKWRCAYAHTLLNRVSLIPRTSTILDMTTYQPLPAPAKLNGGFWKSAIEFLNQNDLLSLARTNSQFHQLCVEEIYHTIVISRDSVLRSGEWFLDCGKTYLAGYRSVKKSPDQVDLFLYDRINRLNESSHLHLVKEVIIQEDVFHDRQAGLVVLEELVQKLLDLGLLEVLDIRDNELFARFYPHYLNLQHLRKCRILDLADLNQLRSIAQVKSLQLMLSHVSFEAGCLNENAKSALSLNIEEVAIEDLEHSSLRLFEYLHDEKMAMSALKSLKFNHVHGMQNYNKTMREFTTLFLDSVLEIDRIKRLELEGSCEVPGCSCFHDFLMALAPHVHNLKELSLIEKTFVTQGDHYTEENWDLTINKFLINLPNVSDRLEKLAIRHNPPLNGIQKDSVEGNYIRRRTLYESVLPRLTSLKTLIAPTFLRSIAPYEVLVCDLLWNGCECDYCTKVLAVIDKFIMNHQFYSFSEGRFKDIIPTVFFGFTGDALSRRFVTTTDWDLNTWSICPVAHYWDLHGYENIQHFHDFDCHYDESVYIALAGCIAHFFNSYMDHLVQLLPSLRSCVLSGVYYAVDGEQEYRSIYD
ncbi:LADA_0H06018g1_1 [Lachancea dasiensis]|uniref:LADA_0H06018g1_1 n=1 Tax=Lachancea dasiensis TaxID=1072105 RepID=A0A1G4K1G2_9SACH|nr:LADA_0H06018g1_1 [Lachancea dasiensis]